MGVGPLKAAGTGRRRAREGRGRDDRAYLDGGRSAADWGKYKGARGHRDEGGYMRRGRGRGLGEGEGREWGVRWVRGRWTKEDRSEERGLSMRNAVEDEVKEQRSRARGEGEADQRHARIKIQIQYGG